jgi:predicted phosphodiesterase
MRLLYLADTHIRGENPRHRRDDFPAALRAKLLEIAGLVRTLEVHAVLHGGDFFDQPCPELSVVGKFVKIFTGMGVPIYVVPGNHDIFACNPDTFEHTMLGLLHQLGSLRVLQAGEKIYLKTGQVSVQLTGTPFHYNIDRQDPVIDYCVTKEDCDFAIHLAHGMLLDRPFFPDTPYTLISQIAPFTEADYTLGSHAHFGYPDVEWKGRKFINPGAIVRLSIQPTDVKRAPQVLLIDFSGSYPVHRKIPLQSAQPGSKVLNTGRAAAIAGQDKGQDEERPWLSSASDDGTGRVSRPDLFEIIEEVARREKLPLVVAHEAGRLLFRVSRNGDTPPLGECPQLGNEGNGKSRVYLERLVLENFQSHLRTELKLVPGLNVILGESNQGKSAIIRALHWLLFNEPPCYSGCRSSESAPEADFVRADSEFCRVTAVFSDQSLITREHSRLPQQDGSPNDAGHPRRAGAGCTPPAKAVSRHYQPELLKLDEEACFRPHFISEYGVPFLLFCSDTVKALAIGRLSGAYLFEEARREVDRRARSVRENGTENTDGQFLNQLHLLLSLAVTHSREETCIQIQNMVNQALRYVFDSAPEFKIVLHEQVEPPEAEFLVISSCGSVNTYCATPNTCGGGVIEVISLALRAAFLELARPSLSGPLVLDEPVKQVSSRFVSHVARFLKGFADAFGRQVIVATCNQSLAGTADAVFILRMESGTSVVYGRGSSIRAGSLRDCFGTKPSVDA